MAGFAALGTQHDGANAPEQQRRQGERHRDLADGECGAAVDQNLLEASPSANNQEDANDGQQAGADLLAQG